MFIRICYRDEFYLAERRAPRSANAARKMVLEEVGRFMSLPDWYCTHKCNIELDQPYMGTRDVGLLYCYSTPGAVLQVRSVFRLDAAAWALRVPGRFQLRARIVPLLPVELDETARRLEIAMAYAQSGSGLSSVNAEVLQMVLSLAGL